MNNPQFSFDVFLSHNSKDKPQVRRLAERLRTAGFRVWFDEWIIQPGDDIYLTIEHGLEASRALILCLSPNALASDWVGLERSTVLFRDPSNKGRRFIPLLLADCELPDALRRYKYVDFREEAGTALEELLDVCRVVSEDNKDAMPLEPAQARPAAKGKRQRKQPAPKSPARKPQPKAKKPASPTQTSEPLAVLERKLTGHDHRVDSVAVSPDGTWLASGSDDHTVKLWDVQTGECRATLTGHTDCIRSVAITPDGQRILSGSFDQSLRIWDAGSGVELAKLEGHTGKIWSVVALPDNHRALSVGYDMRLRLWEFASGTCLRIIQCGTDRRDRHFCLAVNAAGTQALFGHRDGRLRLWNLETGDCLATLMGHSDIVYSVQITPDGQFAVSGSADKTVKIWNLPTASYVATLEGHQGEIDSVALSPDGWLIASTGSSDNTVRLWDWLSGRCLQVITHKGNPWPISVAFSPDGLRLVVGTAESPISPIYIYRLNATRHETIPSETAQRYVNAKVVLLGEGTVGKTSLAYRLIDDKFVLCDRTHGMNVWRLELPYLQPPHPGPLPLGGEGENTGNFIEEREALLWDLAGQEDYRLIHQLFLEETALALLLINPQKDDPFAEAGDWLKALQTSVNSQNAQREAGKLLIFSQTDVGGMKLSNAKIERFCEQYGFAGWLPTSAKTGENCSDALNDQQPSQLKQLIAESIPWDRLPWTSTPRLLAELKNAVVAMRDEADIRLLRFAELAQRLEQVLPGEQFGESEVRTAVTLLANHGLARPLKFGDLVLLRPDLLNGYAGAIIRAARAHKDEIGCVAEAKIYDPAFDFTGVERLHRPDEELLLRALVQTLLEHSLCIAEDTPDGRHLVFPSQYRRERDIPKHPDIFVSYTFSGEWQTIYTTLVVRLWYSREFGHRELWRNAAEFETSKGHALGLKIENKQGEGEASIYLFFDVAVPDELKVIFIEYIHRHLERYAREVRRDRRYVCTACAKPVTDLEAVRKRFDMKKDFIYCQQCDEKVPLIDFIEQRLASDPVARRVLHMDQTATRELDTQALEQILIGHMMAIAGEANQIFRPVTMFDHGIDGEVEFKDNDGKASGKKIYVQLKSGNSYLRDRKSDGNEIFDVKNERHLEYWVNQPVDVYLVIRQQDERSGDAAIRWMNITQYLKEREDKASRQIVFSGEKLDLPAVWRVRDRFFRR